MDTILNSKIASVAVCSTLNRKSPELILQYHCAGYVVFKHKNNSQGPKEKSEISENTLYVLYKLYSTSSVHRTICDPICQNETEVAFWGIGVIIRS